MEKKGGREKRVKESRRGRQEREKMNDGGDGGREKKVWYEEKMS